MDPSIGPGRLSRVQPRSAVGTCRDLAPPHEPFFPCGGTHSRPTRSRILPRRWIVVVVDLGYAPNRRTSGPRRGPVRRSGLWNRRGVPNDGLRASPWSVSLFRVVSSPSRRYASARVTSERTEDLIISPVSFDEAASSSGSWFLKVARRSRDASGRSARRSRLAPTPVRSGPTTSGPSPPWSGSRPSKDTPRVTRLSQFGRRADSRRSSRPARILDCGR